MNYHDENVEGLIEEVSKLVEKIIPFYEYSEDKVFNRRILCAIQNLYDFKKALKEDYIINKEG